GGRRAVRVALAAFLLTASASCNSSSDADRGTASNTVATEPAPTTTTNPYAVPEVIDAAYVNRVLAGLDLVMGDANRALLRARTLTADVYDRLRAIYARNSLLQLVVDAIEDEIRKGFSGYRPDPGNRVTTVTRAITAQSTCIFVSVQRDYSAMSPGPNSPDLQWVALTPLERSRDPHGYNPTSWAMIYDGFTADRSQPENPCLR
ncbi:MAG: hypothetical protein ACRD4B_03070, partial [Acidobacteriota bacterium]